jgi:hypothetical protein
MFSLPQTDGSEATLATAAEQETNTDVQTADQGNAEEVVPTGGSS